MLAGFQRPGYLCPVILYSSDPWVERVCAAPSTSLCLWEILSKELERWSWKGKKSKTMKSPEKVSRPVLLPASLFPLYPSWSPFASQFWEHYWCLSNYIVSIGKEEPASPCSPSRAALLWILRLPQARGYEYWSEKGAFYGLHRCAGELGQASLPRGSLKGQTKARRKSVRGGGGREARTRKKLKEKKRRLELMDIPSVYVQASAGN